MAQQTQRTTQSVGLLAVSLTELITLWAILLTAYEEATTVRQIIPGMGDESGIYPEMVILLRRFGHLLETMQGTPPDDMPMELR